MTATVSTPAGVCNLALAKIGFTQRLGSLYDGTLAAKRCLDIYGQERDALLAVGEWDFCERTINGALLKQAPASYIVTPWTPAYPSLPWRYEYAYPIDAVKIRSVKRQMVMLPNFDPRYNRYSVDNDAGLTPPQKVVLCDVPNAIIVYAGQVTDPNEWSADFLDTLADQLGEALAPVLKGLDFAKMAAAEEGHDEARAAETRG